MFCLRSASRVGIPLQGEVLGTLRHGEGRHTCSSGDSHVGAWQYDKRHGRGTATFASGLRYEGQWREDQAHGWGAINNPAHPPCLFKLACGMCGVSPIPTRTAVFF